jgi:thiol-disulfide isomerase/thioredoxin
MLIAALCALLLSPSLRADERTQQFEASLLQATKSPKVTVVHFWAPWCPNCRHELANGGWSGFIEANPNVNFVFVTLWSPADGRDLLAKNGVGSEPNFLFLPHPNVSRKRDEAVHQVLGIPVSWIPTTWVYKDGHLAYAMNYGEVRFSVLQQLIKDTSSDWD